MSRYPGLHRADFWCHGFDMPLLISQLILVSQCKAGMIFGHPSTKNSVLSLSRLDSLSNVFPYLKMERITLDP
jgi:hypothetical protein